MCVYVLRSSTGYQIENKIFRFKFCRSILVPGIMGLICVVCYSAVTARLVAPQSVSAGLVLECISTGCIWTCTLSSIYFHTILLGKAKHIALLELE